jgi:hypothetical protein
MPFFRPSTFRGQCERCGAWFDPVHGGVCASCGKILCIAHLHGSMLARLRSLLGGQPVCAACRSARRAAR